MVTVRSRVLVIIVPSPIFTNLAIPGFSFGVVSAYPRPILPTWRLETYNVTPTNEINFHLPYPPPQSEALQFNNWEIGVRCMEYTRPPFERVELSDWMAQTPGVSMMAVSDMVWPGTHDTGSL